MDYEQNSNGECSRNCCHFVESPKPYQYVCLVCQRKRDLNESSKKDNLAQLSILFLAGIVAAILFGGAS